MKYVWAKRPVGFPKYKGIKPLKIIIDSSIVVLYGWTAHRTLILIHKDSTNSKQVWKWNQSVDLSGYIIIIHNTQRLSIASSEKQSTIVYNNMFEKVSIPSSLKPWCFMEWRNLSRHQRKYHWREVEELTVLKPGL